MRQRGTLIGFTTMAFLFILLFVYASMKDVIEIWSLILKALPVFAVVGFAVGFVYYLIARWQYEKERRS